MKAFKKIFVVFTIIISMMYAVNGSLMGFEVEKFLKERRIYGGES